MEKMTNEGWMELAEVYHRIMEVVVGHRTIAVSGGFAPHMADFMAAQLHTAILKRTMGE